MNDIAIACCVLGLDLRALPVHPCTHITTHIRVHPSHPHVLQKTHTHAHTHTQTLKIELRASVVWSWESDSGKQIPYSLRMSNMIEDAYQVGWAERVVGWVERVVCWAERV